jgi:hypothetical protein
MRVTGSRFASRVMIKKLGTKMQHLSTASDGRGRVKSLQPHQRKTDAPLCVNFRIIKQGGYKRDIAFFAKCNKIGRKRVIHYRQIIRKNVNFKVKNSMKNTVFWPFFFVQERM